MKREKLFNVGVVLADAWKAKGFSNKDIIDSGVSQPTVSDLVNGHRNPSWENLEKICELIHVPSYLIVMKYGIDKNKPENERKHFEDFLKEQEEELDQYDSKKNNIPFQKQSIEVLRNNRKMILSIPLAEFEGNKKLSVLDTEADILESKTGRKLLITMNIS